MQYIFVLYEIAMIYRYFKNIDVFCRYINVFLDSSFKFNSFLINYCKYDFVKNYVLNDFFLYIIGNRLNF